MDLILGEIFVVLEVAEDSLDSWFSGGVQAKECTI